MINVQRLLGGVVNVAISGGVGHRPRHAAGLGSLLGRNQAAVGMGLLGVAMAAFEHFTQGTRSRVPVGTGVQPPPPPGEAGAVRAPALPASGPTLSPPPHPPPPFAPATSVVRSSPPPPPLPRGATAPSNDSLLLLRAMIAAANADREVDATERARILSRVEEGGITEEERRFLETELASPVSLEQVAAEVRTPQLAEQVYLASLLAVDADTPAEVDHLKRLASRLGLDAGMVARCHESIGSLPLA